MRTSLLESLHGIRMNVATIFRLVRTRTSGRGQRRRPLPLMAAGYGEPAAPAASCANVSDMTALVYRRVCGLIEATTDATVGPL